MASGATRCHPVATLERRMSWSELERLVEEAEADAALRRALSHCRSLPELLLACDRLGYQIERSDLQLARTLDRGEAHRTPRRLAQTDRGGEGPRRGEPGSPRRHEGTRRG
jgi:hypothetical protein